MAGKVQVGKMIEREFQPTRAFEGPRHAELQGEAVLRLWTV
jgi:hypothetical protein